MENFWKLILILSFLISIRFSTALAQNEEKWLKKGEKEFKLGNLKKAYNHFLEVLYLQPENYQARYYAGICHLHSQSPKKALEYLEGLENIWKEQPEDFYYFLATAYYQNLYFSKALTTLDKVQESENIFGEEIERLRQLIYNSEYHYNNKESIIVKNMGGEVNSRNREYSTIITQDHQTVLFTSRSSKLEKSTTSTEDENIFSTRLDNETLEWQKPKAIKGVNSGGNDATVQIFDNDTKMVTYHKGDLFVSELKEGIWQKVDDLKGINTPSYEAHCFITNEGRTIYFSSNFGTDDQDLDLYVSHKGENGAWTAPQPLEELNTPYDEDSPYISEDGTFYFSSKGHSTMGEFDIFKTRYNPETNEWMPPENLGYPINSVFDDIFYVNYGKVAYFSSSRPGGFGGPDIYTSFLFDKVKMKGKLLNKDTNIPICGSRILVKQEADTVYQAVTDQNGEYELVIPIEQQIEISIIQKDKTLLHKQNYLVKVSFKDANKNKYDFVVDLNNFNDEIPIATRDIFSSTKTIKLEAVNSLEENDMLISEDWSPTVALEIDEQLEDKNMEVRNKTKEEWNSVNAKKYLRRLHEGKSLNLYLYFDYNLAFIKEKFYKNLNIIADYLEKNPNIQIEIGGHTDSDGSTAYNENLSGKRAKAVALYLIEKGIDKRRVVARGYGEKYPIASNDDELEGKELNRRVEINIIKTSLTIR